MKDFKLSRNRIPKAIRTTDECLEIWRARAKEPEDRDDRERFLFWDKCPFCREYSCAGPSMPSCPVGDACGGCCGSEEGGVPGLNGWYASGMNCDFATDDARLVVDWIEGFRAELERRLRG